MAFCDATQPRKIRSAAMGERWGVSEEVPVGACAGLDLLLVNVLGSELNVALVSLLGGEVDGHVLRQHNPVQLRGICEAHMRRHSHGVNLGANEAMTAAAHPGAVGRLVHDVDVTRRISPARSNRIIRMGRGGVITVDARTAGVLGGRLTRS